MHVLSTLSAVLLSSSACGVGFSGGGQGGGGAAAAEAGAGGIGSGGGGEGGIGSGGIGGNGGAGGAPASCDGVDEHEDPASGSCYMLPAVGQPFDAARTACMSWRAGADLAAVRSAVELEFVTTVVGITSRTLLGGVATNGGTNGASAADWHWVNGEPWDYATTPGVDPWASNEPDAIGSSGEEACLGIWPSCGGVPCFESAPCTTNSFLCEWAP